MHGRRHRLLLGHPAVWLVLLGLGGLTTMQVLDLTEPPAPSGMVQGRVARVADGDSLYLVGVGPQVRLWGLNAPEYDAPGGQAATDALSRLALGRHLRCEVMDRDHYQRIVGRCRLPDGQGITAAMIKTGAASEYLRFSKGYYSR